MGSVVGDGAGGVALRVTTRVEGDGHGALRGYWGQVTRIFESGSDALEVARNSARSQAETAALALGAIETRITVETSKFFLPDAFNDDGLLKAEIVAEAVGRPTPG